MNPIFATLMLFSGILLLFFGVPISGLFLMSMIGPASPEPISRPMPIAPIANPMSEFLGDPITIQKVSYKGNYIWVDAPPIVATD
ncbi:MAG: hypothetical protein ACERKS_11470 [Candidatus Bathyarchaeota archaeon]